MSINTELAPIVGLFALFTTAGAAYVVRVLVLGRAHFERVDRQGGSRLLDKSLLEMGYWVIQPLGTALIRLGVSANFITWLSLPMGALVGVLLGMGNFGWAALVSLFAGVLDALDGLVARAQGSSSNAGAVLDSSIDRYVDFFFLAGVAVHYRESLPLLLLTLAAALGSFMVSYSTAKAEAIHVKPPRGSMRRTERAVYLGLGAALTPLSRIWLDDPIGYPMILALGIVAIASHFSAIERLRAVYEAAR